MNDVCGDQARAKVAAEGAIGEIQGVSVKRTVSGF
jgi:hypothetical protein